MNERMVGDDEAFVLSQHVPAESISVVHVHFRQPSPEARHHRRRLVQPTLALLVHRALVPGGRVQIVTDHKDYWEENIEPVMRAASGFEVVEYVRPGSANEGEFVGTNIERKYRREGRPFYAIAAVKK